METNTQTQAPVVDARLEVIACYPDMIRYHIVTNCMKIGFNMCRVMDPVKRRVELRRSHLTLGNSTQPVKPEEWMNKHLSQAYKAASTRFKEMDGQQLLDWACA